MPGIRAFGVLAVAGLLSAAPSALLAQAVTEEQVIAALEEQGFTVIEAGTTFLGRIRITAEGPEGVREVVLNPRNGKVLRDMIIDEAPSSATVAAPPPPPVLEPISPVTPPATPHTTPVVPDVAEPARSMTAPILAEPLSEAAEQSTADQGNE